MLHKLHLLHTFQDRSANAAPLQKLTAARSHSLYVAYRGSRCLLIGANGAGGTLARLYACTGT